MFRSSSEWNKHRKVNWRPLLFTLGWLEVVLGGCCLAPAAIALWNGDHSVQHFMFGSLVSLFIGGTLVAAFYSRDALQLKLKDGFLFAALSWSSISAFASIPFYLADPGMSLTDALFESVSYLSTTGVSAVTDSIYRDEGLRFWRMFLQWFGGIGIIFMTMILLPALKIGGSQLMFAESSVKIGGFQLIFTEFSDHPDKTVQRSSQTAVECVKAYVGFTALVVLLLWIGSISPIDSLYYGMATLSTAGSVVGVTPIEEMNLFCRSVLIFGMVLGGSTLSLSALLFKGDWRSLAFDEQIRGYFWVLALAGGLTIAWVWNSATYPIFDGLFMAVSAVSTTGFSFGNPHSGFLGILFLILCNMGACAGSTGGGVKIFRVQVLSRITRNQLLQLIRPFSVFLTFYNRTALNEAITMGLISTLFLYVFSWLLLGLGFSSLGYSAWDGFSLSSSFISNSGIAFDKLLLYSPMDLSPGAKWLGILAMFLGRLECVTLFVVLLMFISKR